MLTLQCFSLRILTNDCFLFLYLHAMVPYSGLVHTLVIIPVKGPLPYFMVKLVSQSNPIFWDMKPRNIVYQIICWPLFWCYLCESLSEHHDLSLLFPHSLTWNRIGVIRSEPGPGFALSYKDNTKQYQPSGTGGTRSPQQNPKWMPGDPKMADMVWKVIYS